MILIPINGKGSINDNNLGERHLLLISCLFVELYSILTGNKESIFKSVPRLYRHCHCCRFSPHALFLGLLLGLQTQGCIPASPYLSSSSTCCLSDLLESIALPKVFCKSIPSPSMTVFLTLPSFASQLYNFFCSIFVSFSQRFLYYFL